MGSLDPSMIEYWQDLYEGAEIDVKDRDRTIADLQREVEKLKDDLWKGLASRDRLIEEAEELADAALERATAAERELAAEREAASKAITYLCEALGARHILEAHRRTVERFKDDPNLNFAEEMSTIKNMGEQIHEWVVKAHEALAAAAAIKGG